MKKILVTGANGFVGRCLCKQLLVAKIPFKATVWNANEKQELLSLLPIEDKIILCDVGPNTDWSEILKDIDVIIHLVVHPLHAVSNSLNIYQKTNVDGVKQLVNHALISKVKRLIYIGSTTIFSKQFADTYYVKTRITIVGFLQELMSKVNMEITILHPSLIYGPGSKALLLYLNLIQSGLPLPFANIKNKYSIVYVENLATAIIKLIKHPVAANKTYNIADCDPSTPELLQCFAKALHRKAKLFPFPFTFVKLVGKILGRSGLINRLTQTEIVDSHLIRQEINWQPTYTLQQSIQFLVDGINNKKESKR